MRSPLRAGVRSTVAAVCVTLTACASQPGPPLWLDAANRSPPSVLRMGEVALANEALPSASGQFAGNAAAGTLIGLGYALPTLGASLLLVPLGLVEGASQAARASECVTRWKAAVGDVNAWLGATFGPVPMLSTVEGEVQRLLVKPPPAVATASASTPEAKSVELKLIGERLATPTLLVGDLWIKLEQPDQSKCGIKFAAHAQFRVQPVDQPPRLGLAYVVSVTQEDKDVAIEDWARDPEQAREQLRRLLRELAARIVASYPWR